MTPLPFIDTNIFLRHIVGDEPDQSPRATAFFEQIEHGEAAGHTSDTVVCEIVYVLQRVYKVPRPEIRDALLPLLGLPGIVLPNKRRFHWVFEHYIAYNLSFADAYHAVLVERRHLAGIMSFDRGLDRVPGLKRLEP